MADIIAQSLRDRYALGLTWVIKSVQDLSEEQFGWRPTSASHSIAFNLWHIARWEDVLQGEVLAKLPNRPEGLRTDQIWHADQVAAQWNLDRAQLGSLEAGTGMDDTVAAGLTFPQKAAVIDYAQRVFDAATRAVSALTDDDFRAVAGRSERPICDYVVTYLAHADFHRGEIAALRRAQSLPRVRV